MALSNDLISEFVKLTNDKSETPKSTTVYGTVVDSDGTKWVQIDGSPNGLLTPIETTTEVSHDDRVIVDIKDHTAVVTGNLTHQSVSTTTTDKIASKISEFEIIVAYKINADDINAINGYFENLKSIVGNFENITTEDLETINASIVYLESKYADIDNITANDVKALNAEIESLKASFASIESISTSELDAAKASIDQLTAYNANFTYVHAEVLRALKADINTLNVDKLNTNFANIDYVKIDQATMDKFYANTGLVEHVTMQDGTVTGYLIGVKIKGDLIEAGTLRADRLIIRGTDGNYYQLNTDFDGIESVEPVTEDMIHGSVIVAESVTADKVKVSDLVAFGATIGGFNITGKDENAPGAIYSGVKASVDNDTRGSYLDTEGQFSFGDSVSYIRYHKMVDADGNEIVDSNGNPIYKLEISADSVIFGGTGRSAEELADLADVIKMGSYTNPDTGESKPSVELSEENGTEKLLLTNENMVFVDGENEGTKLDKDSVSTGSMIVNKEIQHGPLVWAFRANGNYGLIWKGVDR